MERPDGELDEAGVKLRSLRWRFTCLYDFSDGWERDIDALGPGGDRPVNGSAFESAEPLVVDLGHDPETDLLLSHQIAESVAINEVNGRSSRRAGPPRRFREPAQRDQDGAFRPRCRRVPLEQCDGLSADGRRRVITLGLDSNTRRQHCAYRSEPDSVNAFISGATDTCELEPIST